MPAEVIVNQEQLRQILLYPARLFGEVVRESKQRLGRQIKIIAAEGARRAPKQNLHLMSSAETSMQYVGMPNADMAIVLGTITMGRGASEEYARYQHETEDLAHNPTAYQAKYGRRLSRYYTTRKYRTALVRGGVTVRHAMLPRMRRRRDGTPYHLGYFGGNAHFLYGSSRSAYNKTREAKILADIREGLKAVAERLAV